ncbi:MAG: urease accessory protein UreD [Betaproteobacteria bacterium]|nr:urease accessory protein UreD [Betaproteobacteria bacterium]
MRIAEPILASWKAELALEYERRGTRTVLAKRRHEGPLAVQKPFYPEGEAVCHTIVVHPPAGIARGDELELAIRATRGAHALLTTPGAAKWYRSSGPWARQRIAFEVADGAALEWLPQETIVFDGARAELSMQVELAGSARFIGWEVLCLGRSGSGERFRRGVCRIATEIRREGKLLWFERGRLEGGGELLESAVGLGGRTVCATILAAGVEVGAELVAACRRVHGATVTRLPGVLVARHLGDSSEEAKRGFAQLWSALRPGLLGCAATEPRIWRT